MTEAERARAMVDRLPVSMRIGAFDISIERWTSMQTVSRQRYGEFAGSELRISIQHDMPSRLKAADTMLHELGHAIYWIFGIEDADKEERIVNLASTGWLCVYRDNPWLLDWLKECVTSQADLVDQIHELMRP